jgi:hypothetical protein
VRAGCPVPLPLSSETDPADLRARSRGDETSAPGTVWCRSRYLPGIGRSSARSLSKVIAACAFCLCRRPVWCFSNSVGAAHASLGAFTAGRGSGGRRRRRRGHHPQRILLPIRAQAAAMATAAARSTEPFASITTRPVPSAITKASRTSPQPRSSNFSVPRHMTLTFAVLWLERKSPPKRGQRWKESGTPDEPVPVGVLSRA